MVKLLLDEDIKARTLVRLLKEAGYDVVTTAEVGLDGQPDFEVLNNAAKSGRVLMTYNCEDFRIMHRKNSHHSGIIVVYQEPGKSMSYAQIVKALINLHGSGAPISGELHALNQWLF